MATVIFLATIYLITPAYSLPCIPAYTCFEQNHHETTVAFDSSFKMICKSDGSVSKELYLGSVDCSGDPTQTKAFETSITTGDEVVGGSSGDINTDYLQGINCPMPGKSESCSNYMILKHRGTRSYSVNNAGKPYLDIGNNCTNYIGKESTFTQYTSVVIPVGCVNQPWTGGSKTFYCDAQKWGYTHHDAPNCAGTTLSAQSDEFEVDTCDYFSEWTHCSNGESTGCPGEGQHDYWWSWYDLDCCPINGRTCTGIAYGATPPTPHTTEAIQGNNQGSSVDTKCMLYGILMVIGVICNM